MASGALAVGSGWISDDSDFHGSVTTRKRLETEVTEHKIAAYADFHAKIPAVLAYHSVARVQRPETTTELQNPFEDAAHNSRQLSETVTGFLERLPPSTTSFEKVGPWLWIANPRVSHHPLKHDLARLIAEGEEMLRGFTTFKEREKRPRAVKERRSKLEKDLKTLAKSCHIDTGKWMLFPPMEKLDQTWHIVAQAVADGTLGKSAKVATAGAERKEGQRLICVYTYAFWDEADVARVLNKLITLGLCPAASASEDRSRAAIWYKCDAYTHLGIESKNPWGLRASMYNSNDMARK